MSSMNFGEDAGIMNIKRQANNATIRVPNAGRKNIFNSGIDLPNTRSDVGDRFTRVGTSPIITSQEKMNSNTQQFRRFADRA